MKIEFLGAAHTVTGSCYLVQSQDANILIDCGMFQGGRALRDKNGEPFRFTPADIDKVLLTHAHIDHCGLVPKLFVDGYKGDIIATKATCDLLKIMLPDSAHIQEADAEMRTRKGARAGEAPVKPIYTLADAQAALEHISPVEYGQQVQVANNITAVFHDAGHIMGSAMIELFVTENGETTKVLFSGDIGQPGQPIIRDPERIKGVDYLILESTYGDRTHQIYDKEAALADIINDTMDRGGNLVIPAFAVGRTQTMLYYIYRLWKAEKIDDVSVIVDSPMAIAATQAFAQNVKEFDEESRAMLRNGRLPEMPQIRLCQTAAESKAINSEESSAIILSASGMADAGRILHHLKHNLWRPESTILFCGYQAEGTLGRRLLSGLKRVKVMGEEIAVKAKVKMMDGFSAHGDVEQIMTWLQSCDSPKPAKVFVVHGEPQSAEAMKERLENDYGVEAYVPFMGDVVTIEGRSCTIHPSNITEVRVEAELEDFLRTMDSYYRQERRRVTRIVKANPQIMEPVIREMQKGLTYIKKLFNKFEN